jgi:hypothetical protein
MPAKSKPVHPLEGLRVVILSREEMGRMDVASLATYEFASKLGSCLLGRFGLDVPVDSFL